MNRRGPWVYVVLACFGVVVLGWQSMEHLRVREAARQALISRGRDITSTLGIVIRSERRWGGLVSKDRLESALGDLIKQGDLHSIALLNTNGEVVVSVGNASVTDSMHNAPSGVSWSGDSLILANLVDLGVSSGSETNQQRRVIVVADFPPPSSGTASNAPPPRSSVSSSAGTNAASAENTSGRSRGRPRGRPPWMSEAEYRNLIEKQGLHSVVVVLSAVSMQAAIQGDLWIRFVIVSLAAAAVAGAVFAWRNVRRSSDLELRLVKASEMNSHLKQMNLAAAGLAHETRNPLNIIRGLAQLIAREKGAAPEILERSSAIVEESDRVTAQLNEFINYSRPRDVRPSQVRLSQVAAEVARALTFDAEEKQVQLTTPRDDVWVEADEPLLRQALFNLLLNAIQAVGERGQIEVRIERTNGHVALEVRDDGPGVPAERRAEIFRPYFTTHQKGTGLGLAIVQQIVAAHGWDIECGDNSPRGAVFRVSRIKALGRS